MADQQAEAKPIIVQNFNLDLLNGAVNFQIAYGSSNIYGTVREDDMPGVRSDPKKAVTAFCTKMTSAL
jgi:hypothetical protein